MAIVLANQAEPIPGYTLIEPLGHGGFGEVWKAQAPGGIPKAIKFVKGSLNEADGHVPAAQELKALNRVKEVRHPFILTMERVDIIDGQLIIVMELADRNLFNRLEECQARGQAGIPRAELLRYMNEAAEALDLMNGEYQLQHMDIKPQNLFLVHNHVKVADFGLCKDLEGMSATMTSGVTPVYASPETFEGHVSRFSDQYSLAIVYQEMLTGQRPFNGKNARQLLMQHVKAPPDLSPLPVADQEIVGRALAKKPEERFPTCGDFVRALRQAPAVAVPNPPPAVAPAPASTPKEPGVHQSSPQRRSDRATSADFDLEESDGAKRRRRSTPSADEPEPSPSAARRKSEPDTLKDSDEAGRTHDTLEIPPSTKSRRTVKIAKAPKAPVEEVPCPRCDAALINPGPFAWCGNCGYCADVDDKATKGTGGSFRIPAWLLLFCLGLIAVAGLAFGHPYLPPEYRPQDTESLVKLLGAVAAGFLALVVLMAAWPRKAKRSGVRRKRAR